MILPNPAVQRIEHGVTLQGQALVDCAVLVALGLKAGQRDANPPARMRYLADQLADAARSVSQSRHRDVPPEPVLSSSLADEITTREAADILGIGKRQMCRLAPLLGARRTHAGFLIHRGVVLAHQHERTVA